MSRILFISALSISVAIIGGAVWFRFFQISPSQAQVSTVPQIEPLLSDDLSMADFFDTETSLVATSTTVLSQADLIGRQLFADYLALKSQGEVTEGNINALADKYAESIKNFDISIPKVNPNQIMLLPDSEANLVTYGNAMTNLRNKYKNLVANQTGEHGSGITAIDSQAFSTFISAVGKLYQASANELLLVGVPASLALNHIDLINNYLENAEIMGSLGNTAKDPIRSYAALNIYAQHAGKESELFLNIQKTMMAYGIIFDNSI